MEFLIDHWRFGDSAPKRHPAQLQTLQAGDWYHCQRDAKGLREWLLDQNVPSSVIDSLLAEDTRPLFEQYDEQNFLLILRGVNLNDNADPADMLSVRILYYHGALISTRKTPSKAISTVRTA
ncbi:TPA: zinc transporter ZntB, partial [Vibrio cholerae]|nr:zinc transporter ZntB [Vibrio cholerae]